MFRLAGLRLLLCVAATSALLIGARGILTAQPAPDAPATNDAGPPAKPGDTAPTSDSDPLPPPTSFDAQLTSVLREPGDKLSLVGRSGQLYVQAGPRVWERREHGGVSATVQAIYRSGAGKLYAVGDRAPMFARESGLWSVYPLARVGSAAASTGREPVIALQRQIYELGANGWRSIATAPATVKHLWASSPTRIFMVDDDRQVWASRGKAWQRITTKLGPDEDVASLGGIAGKLAVVLTTKGRLLSISGRSTKAIATGEFGAALDIHTLGTANGALVAAGRVEDRTVLVTVNEKTVQHMDDLWPLTDGDRFSIIADSPDGLLVATGRGQLRIATAHAKWRTATITAPPSGATPEFRLLGPARAR